MPVEQEFIVSARKYRPLNFDTVVGQASVTNTLKNSVRSGKIAHAYLFCGPRGVGKTTCARIFARTLNCSNLSSETEACNQCESCLSFLQSRSFNIRELDAASNNSVDDIRALCDQVRVPPQIGRYSIYIIDEVHMLSPSAFNAFLKTLEEPPSHAVFILATTEKHKIIPTILSRCQIFDFKRIRVDDMVAYLSHIALQEGIQFEPEALHVIAQKADGALRDALSILDQMISFTQGNIRYQDVIDNLHVLDYDYYFRLTGLFLSRRYSEALVLFHEILSHGFDGHHFISGLASHFRDLLVCRDPVTLDLLEVGPSVREKYRQQSQQCSEAFLLQALTLCNECDVSYRSSRNPRLLVELTLMKLALYESVPGSALASLSPPAPVLSRASSNSQAGVAPAAGSPEMPVSRAQHSTPAVFPVSPKPQDSIASMPSIRQTMAKAPAVAQNKPSDIPESQKPSLSGAPVPPASEEAPQPSQEPDAVMPSKTLEEASLEQAWSKYAAKMQEKDPRLFRSLTYNKPQVSGEATVLYVVANSLQQEEVSRARASILNFLTAELRISSLELDVQVQEVATLKKYYTAQDKLTHLTETNPVAALLQQQLSLELE